MKKNFAFLHKNNRKLNKKLFFGKWLQLYKHKARKSAKDSMVNLSFYFNYL